MKVAVIGYGHRMAEVMRRLAEVCPELEVAAVCDPAQARVRETMATDGIACKDCRFFDAPETMLDAVRVDGVLIGTRCSLHARLAALVLERSLPLFLEKPIATTLEDAQALWQANLRGGRPPVVVSFPLRLSALAREAKSIVDSGRLGEIAQVQAVNNVPYGPGYFQRWYRDEAETGGLFLQKATHDLDVVNALLGMRPTEVFAMTSKQIYHGQEPTGQRCDRCAKTDSCPESPQNLWEYFGEKRKDLGCCFAQDTGNEDSGSALIRYPNGVHCSYSQNFFARKASAKRMIRLLGYRGSLEFDWYTNQIKVCMHDSGIVETREVPPGPSGHSGGDAALVRAFSRCVLRGMDSPSPLEAGMDSVLTCLAARESAQTRRIVEVLAY
ncbi:MAG: Gfo/Idh/MocA family oxidoreductase [Eubacteriales bacterium]|nr:Gfo/Idh/MocA family oxidoreductase [Eubacteriales bacterium]